MKIINDGWKPWWVGKRITCGLCGRIIELEKDDYVTQLPYNQICSTCEKCGSSIGLKQDDIGDK